MFKNKLFGSKKRREKKAAKKRFTEIPPDEQSIKSSTRDYEGGDNDSNYQAASEYGEDAQDGMENKTTPK